MTDFKATHKTLEGFELLPVGTEVQFVKQLRVKVAVKDKYGITHYGMLSDLVETD